jgi:hypothetical protein
MRKREVTLHEVVIRFLVPEYEIAGAIENATPPEIQKAVETGTMSELDALAWMFDDALSGNEVGSLAREDLTVEIDGAILYDDNNPRFRIVYGSKTENPAEDDVDRREIGGKEE